jgi:hypothetical protein
MPGTPILTQIKNAMVDYITGMQCGLYHFEWCAQEPDLAKASKFPIAIVTLESDDSLDDPDGPDSGMYQNSTIYNIEVYAKLQQEVANPRDAINDELDKAFDDLRKLFGINHKLGGACDHIMYRSMSRDVIANNNILVPSKMHTTWRVMWESDRQNPDQVA